jgi:acyl-CoA reductase-like NAD-dependent aldehyde dehydrogenase
MVRTPYIGGKFIDAPATAALEDVVNPANQNSFAKVLMAGAEHARQAIDAAHAASLTWKNSLPGERETILRRAADIVEAERNEIVNLLIDEAGSTFGKAQFEVSFTVNMLRSIAGEVRQLHGEILPSDVPGQMSWAIRRPLGVVAAITPFNFPLLLSTKKVSFAVATGNTCVLKPAEETSLIGLTIADVFEKAGLPPGVLNVVPGDGPTVGPVLFSDPRVRLVSFTGSTTVGRLVSVECARHGKKAILELGGKSPLIILKDADLEYAIDTACFGMFIHQGQICMAGSRIIVEEPIYEDFLKGFVEKVKKLQVGDPHDPHTVIGPLIRGSQCEFISGKIKTAVDSGARLLTGGTYKNNFYAPTVVADVTPAMEAFRDELFGPVAAVVKAHNSDHALALANDSSYGLSSAVLTNNMQLAMKFALELEAGMVHLNGPTVHDDPHAPFGGVKNSGNGREGGHWSMEELTEVKWITLQLGRRQYPF